MAYVTLSSLLTHIPLEGMVVNSNQLTNIYCQSSTFLSMNVCHFPFSPHNNLVN